MKELDAMENAILLDIEIARDSIARCKAIPTKERMKMASTLYDIKENVLMYLANAEDLEDFRS